MAGRQTYGQCTLAHNRRPFNSAFTLSEVLITLAIIGIVAALTIPSLVQNYQKTQFEVAFVRSYSMFNEALKLMANDYDCGNDLRCTGLFASGGDIQPLGAAITKHFKVIKDCGKDAVDGQEIGEICLFPDMARNYDGSDRGLDLNYNQAYSFITADGASYSIDTIGANCPDIGFSNGKTGDLTQYCGELYMDTNGPNKGPNNMGIDVFYFFISNGRGAKLYPAYGADFSHGYWRNGDGTPSNCYEGNKDGDACAARILEEGFKMNYYSGAITGETVVPLPDPEEG